MPQKVPRFSYNSHNMLLLHDQTVIPLFITGFIYKNVDDFTYKAEAVAAPPAEGAAAVPVVVVVAADPGLAGYHHSIVAAGTAAVAGSRQPMRQHSDLQPACLQSKDIPP